MVQLWVLGVIISITASVFSNLGVNIQKFSLMKEAVRPPEKMRPYVLQPLWVAGLLLVIFGNLGDFIALGFAAQSLITPVGGFAMVANVMFAHFWLKETISRKDLIGTGLIVVGVVLIALFASKAEREYTLEDLTDLYREAIFIVYACFIVAITGSLYILSKYIERVYTTFGGQSWTYRRWRKLHQFIYPTLSGVLGAQSVLFAKSTAELLKRTFAGENQLVYAASYAIIAAMLSTILMQLHWLAVGLKWFDAVYVIPVFQCFFISGTILGGAVYFKEFADFSVAQSIMFPVGVSIILTGIVLLSQRTMTGDNYDSQKSGSVSDEEDDLEGQLSDSHLEDGSDLMDMEGNDGNMVPRTKVLGKLMGADTNVWVDSEGNRIQYAQTPLQTLRAGAVSVIFLVRTCRSVVFYNRLPLRQRRSHGGLPFSLVREKSARRSSRALPTITDQSAADTTAAEGLQLESVESDTMRSRRGTKSQAAASGAESGTGNGNGTGNASASSRPLSIRRPPVPGLRLADRTQSVRVGRHANEMSPTPDGPVSFGQPRNMPMSARAAGAEPIMMRALRHSTASNPDTHISQDSLMLRGREASVASTGGVNVDGVITPALSEKSTSTHHSKHQSTDATMHTLPSKRAAFAQNRRHSFNGTDPNSQARSNRHNLRVSHTHAELIAYVGTDTMDVDRVIARLPESSDTVDENPTPMFPVVPYYFAGRPKIRTESAGSEDRDPHHVHVPRTAADSLHDWQRIGEHYEQTSARRHGRHHGPVRPTGAQLAELIHAAGGKRLGTATLWGMRTDIPAQVPSRRTSVHTPRGRPRARSEAASPRPNTSVSPPLSPFSPLESTNAGGGGYRGTRRSRAASSMAPLPSGVIVGAGLDAATRIGLNAIKKIFSKFGHADQTQPQESVSEEDSDPSGPSARGTHSHSPITLVATAATNSTNETKQQTSMTTAQHNPTASNTPSTAATNGLHGRAGSGVVVVGSKGSRSSPVERRSTELGLQPGGIGDSQKSSSVTHLPPVVLVSSRQGSSRSNRVSDESDPGGAGGGASSPSTAGTRTQYDVHPAVDQV